jgi:phosphopantetheine adenylyltransferase
MQVYTLENPEKVNQYRAQVGLKPLENSVWENTETRENAPKDLAKRQADYKDWLVKVGWRK